MAYGALVPGLVLAGIGMGLFFAPVVAVVLSAVSPSEEGKASSATNAIRELGGVFGIAVLANVFSANGAPTSRRKPSSTGSSPRYGRPRRSSAAAPILTLALPRRRRRPAVAIGGPSVTTA